MIKTASFGLSPLHHAISDELSSQNLGYGYGTAQVSGFGTDQVLGYDTAQVSGFDTAQVLGYGTAQVPEMALLMSQGLGLLNS